MLYKPCRSSLHSFTPLSVRSIQVRTIIRIVNTNLLCHVCLYIEHRCEFPGCKGVIVLDGNMKNRRDICSAKEAGSIQYPGLPGHIKTGCMASPRFKSRYCSNHDERSCSLADSTSDATSDTKSPEGVVEILLAVKETRGSKYYQVTASCCTLG